MQSERQTLPPVPPFGELNETNASSLIQVYSLHYTETLRYGYPQNRKYITYRIAVKGDQS